MAGFNLTAKEWGLVIILTLFSVLFTNKYFILFLNPLNPIWIFLIYYCIIYISLILLSYLGLIVFGVKIKNPLQIFGTSLILFVFFLIFNLENPYVQYVATGSFENTSNIFYGSEDGAIWTIWSSLISPTSNIRIIIIWLLTFPFTTFILSLLAVFLIHKKPQIGFLGS